MLEKIEKAHGRLDVLVPNAACSTHFGSQLDISEKAYDKMWNLNVKSTFFLIKEAKDLLLACAEAGGKPTNVLVISSVTGRTPQHTLGVYAATKAALDNIVKGLSAELLYDKIRVNSLAPGLIATEFSDPLWNNNAEVDKVAIGQAS